MKKYSSRRLLSIVALMLLATLQMAAKVVDVAEASRLAAAFLSPKQKTNSQPVRMRQVKPSAGGRLAAPAVGNPAFYVFTPEEGKGFVIVSADDAATPVLGYSDTQTIDMDNLPPALETLMSQWTEQINLARSQGLEPTAETKAKWAQASPSNPVVLLETAQWNQDSPYNNDCPVLDGERCLTGCVATHYAILFRYYKYTRPASVVTVPYTSPHGAYVPSLHIDGQYDWDNMPLTYPYGGYGDDRDNAVAKLMADIGTLCKANYGKSATDAYQSQPHMLDVFGYKYEDMISRNKFTAEEWDAKLMNCLALGHPISYSADGRSVAHAFILDGYNEDGLYHVNWGWGGYENGFFSLNALNAGGYNFDLDQDAILGVCPIDSSDHSTPDAVAKVGDITFSDLQSAFYYADYTGDGLQILRDMYAYNAELSTLEAGNVNVNLNGYTLSLGKIDVSDSLTVSDTKGGVIKLHGNYGGIMGQGKCTLKGITIISEGCWNLFRTGELDLYDCSVTQTGDNTLGCVSRVVNVYSGRYKSNRGFYGSDSINYYGGLYSFDISDHVAEGYVAIDNNDPATCDEYPYTVIKKGEIPEGTIVVSVNGQKFNTLTTALRYAENLKETANVKLLDDVTVGRIEIQNGNIVLDINGYNMTASEIRNYTNLTICNTGNAGKVELTHNNYSLYNNGILTLGNVNINGGNGNGCFYNDGVAEIRGCTLRANIGQTAIYNNGQCDIYDSEVKCLNGNWLVCCSGDGITNIHSGRYSARYCCYLTDEAQINIYGGVFNIDTTMYVPEGHVVSENTDPETRDEYPYTITKNGDIPEGAVALVNGKPFITLDFAISYAQTLTEIANVKILEDMTDCSIYISKGNVVLDLNGHNMTANCINNSADLTIRNTAVGGKIKAVSGGSETLFNDGTLTLENITVEQDKEVNNYYMLYNNGTAVVRGCTISGYVAQTVICNCAKCDIYDSDITCLSDKRLMFCDEGVINIHTGKFYSTKDFLLLFNGRVNVYGGLFSFDPSAYLAEGVIVTANNDPETAETYPYFAYSPTGVAGLEADGSEPVVHYTMDGRKVDNPRPGSVVITKHSDGSVTKSVYK